MGIVMGITALILGVGAALVSLMIWTALIFVGPTARAREVLEARPWRCFGIGLLIALLLGAPSIALSGSPNGAAKIGGWLLLAPQVAVLVVGLTAMAQLLGERLRGLAPGVTPLGALVRGAVTLELAMLLPFFGWFLFAPLVAITLLGAGTVAVLQASGARRPASVPAGVASRRLEGDEQGPLPRLGRESDSGGVEALSQLAPGA